MPPSTDAALRRLVRSLHRLLRDGEGASSLIERFDELTKLLYCKFGAERGAAAEAFAPRPGESDRAAAARVRRAFRRLVDKNRHLFPNRFARLRLPDATLRRLAEALVPVRLAGLTGDLKGLAYEEVIRNTFDKGDHQQFFTPRPLVEFMVRLLGPSASGLVCDPACGTGGFLLYADRFLKQRGGPARLLGFEIDARLAWVAGINLEMHGARRFTVRHVGGAGALGNAVRKFFGRIDAIVTNPPFGSDLAGAALADFVLGRGRTSRRRGVLFLERCLDLLKPGGRLAIIIDDSVLNGPANADVRQLVLERAYPFAIISLPDTAFMPYASVQSSVLFLQKKGGRKPALRRERGTFFARAEAVGRKPNGDPLLRINPETGRPELDSDLPGILEAWRAETPREGTFWAEIPGIHDRAFARDGYRLDLAYHHPSRPAAARSLRQSPHPLLSLTDLCAIRNEAIVPARALPDEQIIYVGLAQIEANTGACSPVVIDGASVKSTVRRFRAGDLLFAKLRPGLRKVCLVPAAIPEGYCSAECLVLVPRTDPRTGAPLILPELLAVLLRSDLAFGQLVHLITGIGRPRLPRSAVLRVRMPVPPPEEQRRLLEEYQAARQASAALFGEAAQAQAKARQLVAAAQDQMVRNILNPLGFSRPAGE